jgi:hypothetical protein
MFMPPPKNCPFATTTFMAFPEKHIHGVSVVASECEPEAGRVPEASESAGYAVRLDYRRGAHADVDGIQEVSGGVPDRDSSDVEGIEVRVREPGHAGFEASCVRERSGEVTTGSDSDDAKREPSVRGLREERIGDQIRRTVPTDGDEPRMALTHGGDHRLGRLRHGR